MARDSMTLDEVIQFTKQALEKVNPDNRVHTEFRFEVWQVKQLLLWLEDYKQIKADYIDIDKQLRTANTEIDRLQSVSSLIPLIMIKNKDLLIQRIKNSLSFTALEKRYLIKAVEMAPETFEEDNEDAGDKKQRRS